VSQKLSQCSTRTLCQTPSFKHNRLRNLKDYAQRSFNNLCSSWGSLTQVSLERSKREKSDLDTGTSPIERRACHRAGSRRKYCQQSSERIQYMKRIEGKTRKQDSDSSTPFLDALQHQLIAIKKEDQRRNDDIKETLGSSIRRSRDFYHKKSCCRSDVQTHQTSKYQQQSSNY